MRGFLALLVLSTTAAAQQLDYHTFTPSTGIPETYVVAHAGDGALGPLIVMLHGLGGDHDEVVDLNNDGTTCNDWNFLAQATNWSQGPDDSTPTTSRPSAGTSTPPRTS